MLSCLRNLEIYNKPTSETCSNDFIKFEMSGESADATYPKCIDLKNGFAE
jgi:hypothetical protein